MLRLFYVPDMRPAGQPPAGADTASATAGGGLQVAICNLVDTICLPHACSLGILSVWRGFFRAVSWLGMLRLRRMGKRLARLFLRWSYATPVEYCRINIEEVWPDKPEEEREQMVQNSIEHMCSYLMENMFAWGAPEKVSAYCGEMQGFEAVRQEQENGRPVLLFTPHAGCTELASVAISDKLKDSIILYRKLKPHSLYKAVEKNRFGLRCRALPVQPSTTITLSQFLRKQGGAVGMAIDTAPKGAGSVRSSFMGVAIHTADFPRRLMRLTKAKAFGYIGIRTDSGFNVHILEADPAIGHKDKQQAARAFNREMERLFALAPEQGHWHLRRFVADEHILARYASVRDQKRRIPRHPYK